MPWPHHPALSFTLLVLMAGFAGQLFAAEPEVAEVSVMTFNIRYDNPADEPNHWPARRDRVAELIGEHDIAGLQEALKNQIDDLQQRLPEFAWYGVGRNDGQQAGEFVPIFYRKDRFEALEQGTFWLSQTPDTPGSKSWDSALPRVTSWLKLKHQASGREFFVFNTHFDHLGAEARRQSALLLRERIQTMAPDQPVVLTGDFNTLPGSVPYNLLTSDPESALLQDAMLVTAARHQGPDSTWNGFQQIAPGRRIDFILVAGPIEVTSHEILDARVGDRFASDHLPVVAELRIARE